MILAKRLSLVMTGLVILVSVIGWIKLPADTPLHLPYIDLVLPLSKTWLLLQIPVVAVLVHLAYLGIGRLSKHRDNLEQSHALYTVQWIGVQAALLALYGEVMAFMVTGFSAPVSLFLVVCGINAVLTGNYMTKSRAHAAIGIATKSSMEDPDAWERAHRVAGPLYMLTGVAILVAALMNQPWAAIMIGVGGALVVALTGVVIAWRVASR